jgi:hypothetical protein
MLGVNTFSALLFAVSGLFTKSVVIVFSSDDELQETNAKDTNNKISCFILIFDFKNKVFLN